MRFYLISDNVDTHMGMRLAGIEGEIVHEKDEFLKSVDRAMADPEIGILLITEKLVELCPEEIDSYKLRRKHPLIVEVPDRHGGNRAISTLERYVNESIGIKV
ncbi:V-type ATP synthase subunit F [Anaerolentibacter hominis]|uniref:V-type ATP synthase subunit F n=1 Tax=Anaerolentibacter hominis TaxID=3079009 RepID=UPI0031B7F123